MASAAINQDQVPDIVYPLSKEVLPLLDPEFVQYYNRSIGIKLPTHQIDLALIREDPAKYAGAWCKDYTGEPGVTNFSIPSEDGYMIPCRSYTPDPNFFGPGPYPVHINFHGGGFVFGDLTADGKWCMTLRNRVGLFVVDVDYRLMPENVFGKNMEDGSAVLIHILKHGSELNCNPASISLGGISAGGHLSAVMQHMARDAGIPLKLACLSVPTCDYQTYFPDSDGHTYPSVTTMAKAPCLDASRLAYFRSKVFSPEHQAFIQTLPVLWRAPLHAKNFKGLCDTYLSSAQCDPLVDEGEAYGRKVLEAGGKVTFRRYMGVPHPFMHMDLKQARQYDDDLCGALKVAHGL